MSPPRPTVSVVTTSYGHRSWLPQYFESLLAQTFTDVELLFVDDGSPDDSIELARRYEPDLRAKFRAVVVERTENRGFLRQLQGLVGRATGRWLCILESDDWYLPRKLEENVAAFERRPECGIVYSDYDLLEEATGVRTTCSMRVRGIRPVEGSVAESLLRTNPIATVTACARTELAQAADFREMIDRRFVLADLPLWLTVVSRAPAVFLPESLAVYRRHVGSQSNPRSAAAQFRFRKGSLEIRRLYAARLEMPEAVRRTIDATLHRHMYYDGFEAGLAEEFEAGRAALRAEDPAAARGARDFLRRVGVRVPPLRPLASRVLRRERHREE